MEYITPSYIGEENKGQINVMKIHGETVDSERCESTELNLDITREIKQNICTKAKEALLVSKTQTIFQSNICHQEMLTQFYTYSRNQNNMSPEAYKERIQKLEKQRTELLEVNKQWDSQFRTMKQAYEKEVSELKMKLSIYEGHTTEEHKHLRKSEHRHYRKDQIDQPSEDLLLLEMQNIKEENCLLRTQNDALYRRKEYYKEERDQLSKALVKATQIYEEDKAKARLDIQEKDLDCDDLRAEVAALLQQVKIYEEDFRQERADKEKLCHEKEKLQQTNNYLRLQIQMNKFKL